MPRERVRPRVAAAADHRPHLVMHVRQALQQGLYFRRLGLC